MKRRLLLITFIESFATICVERGIYFYSRQRLGFTDVQNLWLALAFGVAYVFGALVSHRLSEWMREKRALYVCLVGQFVFHLGLACWANPAFVFACSTAVGLLNGLKWPQVESYVTAGLAPRQTARVIGWFNLSWAGAVPVCLAVAGPCLRWWPPALFLLPAAINAAAMILSRPLPQSPTHLPLDHPERPAGQHLQRGRTLMTASRWLLLCSYSCMWVLAALLPRIMEDLHVPTGAGAPLSGLLDIGRIATFFLMQRWIGWHDRWSQLAIAGVLLPVSFFLVIGGGSLPIVLPALLAFGVMSGVVYYVSLYHAIVVKNAAVDAGGGHEGLIGTGFALGPMLGLVATYVGPGVGGKIPGYLIGVGPLILLCLVGTAWCLRQLAGKPAAASER